MYDLQPTMTEQEVNKIALSALRSYYRLRLKSGQPELTSDMRGAGGIIADGAYSFLKTDGERFLATIEATSADKKDEVYFKLRRRLLIWDGVAFASTMTTLVFGWNYIHRNIWIKTFGVWQSVGLLLLWFLGFFVIFVLAFYWMRRYRYIYAVEQFRQYHADEQWVAIANDVFPTMHDRRFLELRNQCIYNGFGLMMIDEKRKPVLIITPARRELLTNRRMVQFFSQGQLNRIFKGGMKLPEWWLKFSKGIPFNITPSDPKFFLRFRRPIFNQMMVCGIAWIMTLGIFYVEWQMRPTRYIGKRTYTEEVTMHQAKSRPEPNRPIIPIGDSMYIQPFNNKVIPYLVYFQLQNTDSLTVLTDNDLLVGSLANTMIIYDCERIYKIRSPKYILQEGIYPDFESAAARISDLRKEGYQANSLWMGCFTENNRSYVVYFDVLFDSRVAAEHAALSFNKSLKEKQLGESVSIKTLMPKR